MKIKSVIFKFAAALFVAAYLLSLAGFDIHTCSHSGKTYISFLAASLSCEDIHPEHDAECHCCGCAHEHHSNEDGGCCSDEPHQLLIGCDDCGFDFKHVSAPVSEMPALVVSDSFTTVGYSAEARSFVPYIPSHAPDILHSYCVLRI